VRHDPDTGIGQKAISALRFASCRLKGARQGLSLDKAGLSIKEKRPMRAFSRRHLMAACAAIATISIVSTGFLIMSNDNASAQSGKPVTTSSGLQMIDTQAGTGASPKQGQTAVVHYTGYLNDNGNKGKKFDSSVDRGQPFEFPIGQGRVIKGWDEGVASMKVGGKRTLIIPPALGYGASGAGGVIPPNATLIFDVELLGVK
jgi:peptidylprolyl isomerase